MVFPSKHISISINRSPDEVYAFASNPENLPKWAAGLSSGIRKDGDAWLTDSPMGVVRVQFARENTYGILDHIVTLPSGATVHNPMRSFANNGGTEVLFTLYRLPDMSEQQFREDAAMVDADLKRLKQLLEASPTTSKS